MRHLSLDLAHRLAQLAGQVEQEYLFVVEGRPPQLIP
jgi:hypothetical protein